MKKANPADATRHAKNSEESRFRDEDHDVIRLVLNGDTDRYKVLVKKYQGPVFNLFMKMINNYEDAEELTQDVFVRAYESLSGFNFKYRFFSWIYRIAINRALAEQKHNQRHTDIEQIAHKLSENDEATRDQNAHIKMAIDALKDNYKAVVILKYYEQLSYKEIAVVLEIPEKKVRSRLYDARIKMKETLEKTGYF